MFINCVICSPSATRFAAIVDDMTASVRSRLAASARIAAPVRAKRRASLRLVRSASSQTMPISAGTTHSAAMNSTSATVWSDASAGHASQIMPPSQDRIARVASTVAVARPAGGASSAGSA